MDNDGNIYDLQGNFIGTTGGDDEEGEDQDTSQVDPQWKEYTHEIDSKWI